MNYALLKFLNVNRVNVFACCIALFQALFNGPFTSCPQPLFQSEGKCKANDIKMIFHSHTNKLIFALKGFVLRRVVRERVFKTRKWSITY